MTSDTAQVLEPIRGLRAAGYSPKQIARALHLRPAVVAPLVRKLAAEEAARRRSSPRWSRDLAIAGQHDWPDLPVAEDGPAVVACVAVAALGTRQVATSRWSAASTDAAIRRVCWYLARPASRVRASY